MRWAIRDRYYYISDCFMALTTNIWRTTTNSHHFWASTFCYLRKLSHSTFFKSVHNLSILYQIHYDSFGSQIHEFHPFLINFDTILMKYNKFCCICYTNYVNSRKITQIVCSNEITIISTCQTYIIQIFYNKWWKNRGNCHHDDKNEQKVRTA